MRDDIIIWSFASFAEALINPARNIIAILLIRFSTWNPPCIIHSGETWWHMDPSRAGRGHKVVVGGPGRCGRVGDELTAYYNAPCSFQFGRI